MKKLLIISLVIAVYGTSRLCADTLHIEPGLSIKFHSPSAQTVVVYTTVPTDTGPYGYGTIAGVFNVSQASPGDAPGVVTRNADSTWTVTSDTRVELAPATDLNDFFIPGRLFSYNATMDPSGTTWVDWNNDGTVRASAVRPSDFGKWLQSGSVNPAYSPTQPPNPPGSGDTKGSGTGYGIISIDENRNVAFVPSALVAPILNAASQVITVCVALVVMWVTMNWIYRITRMGQFTSREEHYDYKQDNPWFAGDGGIYMPAEYGGAIAYGATVIDGEPNVTVHAVTDGESHEVTMSRGNYDRWFGLVDHEEVQGSEQF